MRPYLPVRNAQGKITSRDVFRTDYSTPRTMFTDYTRGQNSSDNKYRKKSAFMGHAFARVESRTPAQVHSDVWTGQSGIHNTDFITDGVCAKVKAGVLFWHPFSGHEDSPRRCIQFYEKFYEKPENDSYLSDLGNSVLRTRMLSVSEFRVQPEIVNRLFHYREEIHDFSRYALDSTTKAEIYRAGCATYIGMLTQYSGLIDVEKQWVTERMMPLVTLESFPDTVAGLGWVGQGPAMLQAAEEFCDEGKNPHSKNWGDAGDAGGQYRSLKFVDPYSVSDWSDRISANMPHRIDPRSLIIRYDVPNPDHLKSWERNDP